MTIAIPESVYWRDPGLGPPPKNSVPMPLSVCLLCQKINIDSFEAGEFELDSADQSLTNNMPSYQICIGKGKRKLRMFWFLKHLQVHVEFQEIFQGLFRRPLIALTRPIWNRFTNYLSHSIPLMDAHRWQSNQMVPILLITKLDTMEWNPTTEQEQIGGIFKQIWSAWTNLFFVDWKWTWMENMKLTTWREVLKCLMTKTKLILKNKKIH